eukprot:3361853-Amphidinium_carterae.1
MQSIVRQALQSGGWSVDVKEVQFLWPNSLHNVFPGYVCHVHSSVNLCVVDSEVISQVAHKFRDGDGLLSASFSSTRSPMPPSMQDSISWMLYIWM